MARPVAGVAAGVVVMVVSGCSGEQSLTIRKAMVYLGEDGGRATISALGPDVPLEVFSDDRGVLTAHAGPRAPASPCPPG
jgi:hypothetical protein